MAKKKALKPWWKNHNMNNLKIRGLEADWDGRGYNEYGVNVNVKPIKSSETAKTIKLKLSANIIDQEAEFHSIPKAKKTIMINSKTTKTKLKKIISDFHKNSSKKAQNMPEYWY